MPRQSKGQKETVGRVMHEFKHGELRIRGTGPKVKNPKQAVAIALREAGASRQQSPQEKRQSLSRTKAKERRGETAEAETEGKAAQDRTMRRQTARKRADDAGKSRSELYAEVRRRNIPGRSKMSKGELERALHR
ncbi:hypothetical protein KXR53_10785 [Inquilinus limosus]|uniref:DUF6496 domain-containing protein n=1 Tax=Inquilinus limosus TaxID=171674 RepID=UPI003F181D99